MAVNTFSGKFKVNVIHQLSEQFLKCLLISFKLATDLKGGGPWSCVATALGKFKRPNTARSLRLKTSLDAKTMLNIENASYIDDFYPLAIPLVTLERLTSDYAEALSAELQS